MKRFVPFLALLLCVCLIGCGGVTVVGKKASSEVPEKMIQWEIDDYLEEFSDFGGAYTDYTVSITHDPDKETKTDTVSIDLTITYPSSIANNQWQITYQYDKSKETWDVLRTSGWEPPRVKQYFIKETFQEWSDAYYKTDFGFEHGDDEIVEEIGDIMEIIIDPDGQIRDAWKINVSGSKDKRYSINLNVTVEIIKDEGNATPLDFNNIEEKIARENEIIRTYHFNELSELSLLDAAQGESYEYVRYMSKNGELYGVYIRNNTMYISVSGYIGGSSDWKTVPCIDEFLARVGFVTNAH
jgi:hypothetical protein